MRRAARLPTTLFAGLGLGLAAPPATADVELADSVIEVGLTYGSAPQHFGGEHEPLTTTSLHVTDRNGAFGKFLMALLNAPSDAAIDPAHHHYEEKTWEYLGVTVVKDTVTYDTPEELAARYAERARRQREFAAFNGYTTEFEIFAPEDRTSNTRGAAFGITAALFGNGYVRFETGVHWSYIKGPVCGPEAAPTTCASGFAGIPARVTVALPRLGWLDVGVGWNWRHKLEEGVRQNRNPVQLGLTLNPIDRVYLRAHVLSTTQDLTHPGFVVEVGGRL